MIKLATRLGKIEDAKGYRSCQGGYAYWKGSGEITKNPQPGDIVLFDWTGDGHCDHTGIFEKWIKEGSTFSTIEGNTAIGNDSDGGCVMQRTRNAATVKAFVSPKILAGAAGATSSDTVPTPVSDVLTKGDKGSDVAVIQKLLYDLGYTIVVDGSFGPKTAAVIKQFQKENSLTADGIASTVLTAQLQQALKKKLAPDTKLTTGSFLQKGASGAGVVALQKALNKKMGTQMTEDGVFGNGTAEAVKKFQAANGLTADGIAGPATFAALGIKNI